MKYLNLITLIGLMLSACAADVKVKTDPINEAKTREVLDHHLQTFQQNDLEGVMADYVEESVLVTSDRTFTGLKEIRENFVNAFGALPTKGTTFAVLKSVI